MENYTFCEKITPKRPVKRPIIRSQKYRICNHNFFFLIFNKRMDRICFCLHPCKICLITLITSTQDCGASHIFEKWMDRKCTFCPSISQKCVGPLNLVQKWLEFEGFRPFFGFRAFMSGLSLHLDT